MPARVLSDLSCEVLERGWLSSNNVLFRGADDECVVVDTGYCTHADQTVALLQARLGSLPLARIVNTHLHSDHCGGNARLQRQWGCPVLVPEASFEAARSWDQKRLSYESTGQSCPRFDVQESIAAGQPIRLGGREWNVVEAPGHDPDAVMLFEPVSRTLISGDALWESRLAIIFPELTLEGGFAEARAVLDRIESLAPLNVIPGHGRPFCDVKGALAASRSRLERYEQAPQAHLDHAFRALVMFRMLEIRSCGERELVKWVDRCPLFVAVRRGNPDRLIDSSEIVEGLVNSGALKREEGRVVVAR